MAAALPLGWKLVVIVVHPVRLSVFPLVLFAVGGGTRLELMCFVSCTRLVFLDVLVDSALVVMFVRHGSYGLGCKCSTAEKW